MIVLQICVIFITLLYLLTNIIYKYSYPPPFFKLVSDPLLLYIYIYIIQIIYFQMIMFVRCIKYEYIYIYHIIVTVKKIYFTTYLGRLKFILAMLNHPQPLRFCTRVFIMTFLSRRIMENKLKNVENRKKNIVVKRRRDSIEYKCRSSSSSPVYAFLRKPYKQIRGVLCRKQNRRVRETANKICSGNYFDTNNRQLIISRPNRDIR